MGQQIWPDNKTFSRPPPRAGLEQRPAEPVQLVVIRHGGQRAAGELGLQEGKFDIAEAGLERARRAGFSQFLFDTAVLDLVEPGPCAKTIWMLKNKYGVPAGCSPTHMVNDRWSMGREKFGKLGYTTAKTSLATSITMLRAEDFMYGIKQLEIVPAMVDAAIAYTGRQQRVRPRASVNPLGLLMRKAGS